MASGEQLAPMEDWFGFAELTTDNTQPETALLKPEPCIPETKQLTLPHLISPENVQPVCGRKEKGEIVVPIVSKHFGIKKFKVLARQKAEDDEDDKHKSVAKCNENSKKDIKIVKGNVSKVKAIVERHASAKESSIKSVPKKKTDITHGERSKESSVKSVSKKKTDITHGDGSKENSIKSVSKKKTDISHGDRSKESSVKSVSKKKTDIIKHGDRSKESSVKSVPKRKTDISHGDRSKGSSVKCVPKKKTDITHGDGSKESSIKSLSKKKTDITHGLKKKSKKAAHVNNVIPKIKMKTETSEANITKPKQDANDVEQKETVVDSSGTPVEVKQNRQHTRKVASDTTSSCKRSDRSRTPSCEGDHAPAPPIQQVSGISELSKCTVALRRDSSIDNIQIAINADQSERETKVAANDDLSEEKDSDGISDMKIETEESNVSGDQCGEKMECEEMVGKDTDRDETGNGTDLVNHSSSGEEAKPDMVFDVDIDLRKSGRLKSSKCASRYRGDYGIRAETYTKLLQKTQAPDDNPESVDLKGINGNMSVSSTSSNEGSETEETVISKKKGNEKNDGHSRVKHRARKSLLRDKCKMKIKVAPKSRTSLDLTVALHSTDNANDGSDVVVKDESILVSDSVNILTGVEETKTSQNKESDIARHTGEDERNRVDISTENSPLQANIAACEQVKEMDRKMEICDDSQVAIQCSELVPCEQNICPNKEPCDRLQRPNNHEERAVCHCGNDSNAGKADAAKDLIDEELTEGYKTKPAGSYVHSVGKSVMKKQNQVESKKVQKRLDLVEEQFSPVSSQEKLEPAKVLESLRCKLFEKAGANIEEANEKSKVFECKLITSQIKGKTKSEEQLAVEASLSKSGRSTPQQRNETSGELLEEVTKTLDILHRKKRKSQECEESCLQQSKRPRSERKTFLLRSMFKRMPESDVETIQQSVDDLRDKKKIKLTNNEDIPVEGSLHAFENIQIKNEPEAVDDLENNNQERENGESDEDNESLANITPVVKDCNSNKTKVRAKPKSIKCQACGHSFKTKELLRRHYPCRIRQTRTWSQNKLRPKRASERQSSVTSNKKFVCKLPKTSKPESKHRLHLFTFKKTKFRRVKGKRRRKLYQLIQELIGKRKLISWPHLKINFHDLSFKEQSLYKLGLYCVGNSYEGQDTYSETDNVLFEEHRQREKDIVMSDQLFLKQLSTKQILSNELEAENELNLSHSADDLNDTSNCEYSSEITAIDEGTCQQVGPKSSDAGAVPDRTQGEVGVSEPSEPLTRPSVSSQEVSSSNKINASMVNNTETEACYDSSEVVEILKDIVNKVLNSCDESFSGEETYQGCESGIIITSELSNTSDSGSFIIFDNNENSVQVQQDADNVSIHNSSPERCKVIYDEVNTETCENESEFSEIQNALEDMVLKIEKCFEIEKVYYSKSEDESNSSGFDESCDIQHSQCPTDNVAKDEEVLEETEKFSDSDQAVDEDSPISEHNHDDLNQEHTQEECQLLDQEELSENQNQVLFTNHADSTSSESCESSAELESISSQPNQTDAHLENEGHELELTHKLSSVKIEKSAADEVNVIEDEEDLCLSEGGMHDERFTEAAVAENLDNIAETDLITELAHSHVSTDIQTHQASNGEVLEDFHAENNENVTRDVVADFVESPNSEVVYETSSNVALQVGTGQDYSSSPVITNIEDDNLEMTNDLQKSVKDDAVEDIICESNDNETNNHEDNFSPSATEGNSVDSDEKLIECQTKVTNESDAKACSDVINIEIDQRNRIPEGDSDMLRDKCVCENNDKGPKPKKDNVTIYGAYFTHQYIEKKKEEVSFVECMSNITDEVRPCTSKNNDVQQYSDKEIQPQTENELESEDTQIRDDEEELSAAEVETKSVVTILRDDEDKLAADKDEIQSVQTAIRDDEDELVEAELEIESLEAPSMDDEERLSGIEAELESEETTIMDNEELPATESEVKHVEAPIRDDEEELAAAEDVIAKVFEMANILCSISADAGSDGQSIDAKSSHTEEYILDSLEADESSQEEHSSKYDTTEDETIDEQDSENIDEVDEETTDTHFDSSQDMTKCYDSELDSSQNEPPNEDEYTPQETVIEEISEEQQMHITDEIQLSNHDIHVNRLANTYETDNTTLSFNSYSSSLADSGLEKLSRDINPVTASSDTSSEHNVELAEVSNETLKDNVEMPTYSTVSTSDQLDTSLSAGHSLSVSTNNIKDSMCKAAAALVDNEECVDVNFEERIAISEQPESPDVSGIVLESADVAKGTVSKEVSSETEKMSDGDEHIKDGCEIQGVQEEMGETDKSETSETDSQGNETTKDHMEEVYKNIPVTYTEVKNMHEGIIGENTDTFQSPEIYQVQDKDIECHISSIDCSLDNSLSNNLHMEEQRNEIRCSGSEVPNDLKCNLESSLDSSQDITEDTTEQSLEQDEMNKGSVNKSEYTVSNSVIDYINTESDSEQCPELKEEVAAVSALNEHKQTSTQDAEFTISYEDNGIMIRENLLTGDKSVIENNENSLRGSAVSFHSSRMSERLEDDIDDIDHDDIGEVEDDIIEQDDITLGEEEDDSFHQDDVTLGAQEDYIVGEDNGTISEQNDEPLNQFGSETFCSDNQTPLAVDNEIIHGPKAETICKEVGEIINKHPDETLDKKDAERSFELDEEKIEDQKNEISDEQDNGMIHKHDKEANFESGAEICEQDNINKLDSGIMDEHAGEIENEANGELDGLITSELNKNDTSHMDQTDKLNETSKENIANIESRMNNMSDVLNFKMSPVITANKPLQENQGPNINTSELDEIEQLRRDHSATPEHFNASLVVSECSIVSFTQEQIEVCDKAKDILHQGETIESPPLLEKIESFQCETFVKTPDVTLELEDSVLSTESGPPLLEPQSCVANEETCLDSDSSNKENITECQIENENNQLNGSQICNRQRSERHFLDVFFNEDDEPAKQPERSETNFSAEDSNKMSETVHVKESIGRHFSDVMDDTCQPKLTISKIKKFFDKKSTRREFTKDSLLKVRTGIADLLTKVKAPTKRDPSWLKRNALSEYTEKQGRTRFKEKLKKKGIENSSRTFQLEDSSDGEISDDSCPNVAAVDESIQMVEKTWLDDNLMYSDGSSKGGITKNILQMLTSFEAKGSIADNMTSLFDILAENLGFSSKSSKTSEDGSINSEDSCSNVEVPAHIDTGMNDNPESIMSDDEPPCLDDIPTAKDFHPLSVMESMEVQGNDDRQSNASTGDGAVDKSELSKEQSQTGSDHEGNKIENVEDPREENDVNSLIGNKKSDVYEIIPNYTDKTFTVSKMEPGFFESPENIVKWVQHSEELTTGIKTVEEMKKTKIFKSITELNSIEADDSNSEDDYIKVPMSQQFSKLKAMSKDEMSSAVNSDIMSNSDTNSLCQEDTKPKHLLDKSGDIIKQTRDKQEDMAEESIKYDDKSEALNEGSEERAEESDHDSHNAEIIKETLASDSLNLHFLSNEGQIVGIDTSKGQDKASAKSMELHIADEKSHTSEGLSKSYHESSDGHQQFCANIEQEYIEDNAVPQSELTEAKMLEVPVETDNDSSSENASVLTGENEGANGDVVHEYQSERNANELDSDDLNLTGICADVNNESQVKDPNVTVLSDDKEEPEIHEDLNVEYKDKEEELDDITLHGSEKTEEFNHSQPVPVSQSADSFSSRQDSLSEIEPLPECLGQPKPSSNADNISEVIVSDQVEPKKHLTFSEDPNCTAVYSDADELKKATADNDKIHNDETLYSHTVDHSEDMLHYHQIYHETFSETIAEKVKRKQRERLLNSGRSDNFQRRSTIQPQNKQKEKAISIFRSAIQEKKRVDERKRQMSVPLEVDKTRPAFVKDTSVPKELKLTPCSVQLEALPVQTLAMKCCKPCSVRIQKLDEKNIAFYSKKMHRVSSQVVREEPKPPIKVRINLKSLHIAPPSPFIHDSSEISDSDNLMDDGSDQESITSFYSSEAEREGEDSSSGSRDRSTGRRTPIRLNLRDLLLKARQTQMEPVKPVSPDKKSMKPDRTNDSDTPKPVPQMKTLDNSVKKDVMQNIHVNYLNLSDSDTESESTSPIHTIEDHCVEQIGIYSEKIDTKAPFAEEIKTSNDHACVSKIDTETEVTSGTNEELQENTDGVSQDSVVKTTEELDLNKPDGHQQEQGKDARASCQNDYLDEVSNTENVTSDTEGDQNAHIDLCEGLIEDIANSSQPQDEVKQPKDVEDFEPKRDFDANAESVDEMERDMLMSVGGENLCSSESRAIDVNAEAVRELERLNEDSVINGNVEAFTESDHLIMKTNNLPATEECPVFFADEIVDNGELDEAVSNLETLAVEEATVIIEEIEQNLVLGTNVDVDTFEVKETVIDNLQEFDTDHLLPSAVQDCKYMYGVSDDSPCPVEIVEEFVTESLEQVDSVMVDEVELETACVSYTETETVEANSEDHFTYSAGSTELTSCNVNDAENAEQCVSELCKELHSDNDSLRFNDNVTTQVSSAETTSYETSDIVNSLQENDTCSHILHQDNIDASSVTYPSECESLVSNMCLQKCSKTNSDCGQNGKGDKTLVVGTVSTDKDDTSTSSLDVINNKCELAEKETERREQMQSCSASESALMSEIVEDTTKDNVVTTTSVPCLDSHLEQNLENSTINISKTDTTENETKSYENKEEDIENSNEMLTKDSTETLSYQNSEENNEMVTDKLTEGGAVTDNELTAAEVNHAQEEPEGSDEMLTNDSGEEHVHEYLMECVTEETIDAACVHEEDTVEEASDEEKDLSEDEKPDSQSDKTGHDHIVMETEPEQFLVCKTGDHEMNNSDREDSESDKCDNVTSHEGCESDKFVTCVDNVDAYPESVTDTSCLVAEDMDFKVYKVEDSENDEEEEEVSHR